MRLLCASTQLAERVELRAVLSSAGFVLDCVPDLGDARKAVTLYPYDLVVIGAGARIDGALRWIRRCRAEQPLLPILLQTDGEHLEDRIATLEAGADGCFRLPIQPRDLIARLRALARGPRPTHPSSDAEAVPGAASALCRHAADLRTADPSGMVANTGSVAGGSFDLVH